MDRNINDEIVSRSDLAIIFGLSAIRVSQLEQEGIISKVDRGKYNLVDSVRRYVKFKDGLKNNTSERIDLEKEKAIHERIKRELSEIELKILKGKVLKVENIQLILEKIFTNFKTKILGLPIKLAPVLLAQTELGVIQEVLKKECYELLEEFSDTDIKMLLGEEIVNEE